MKMIKTVSLAFAALTIGTFVYAGEVTIKIQGDDKMQYDTRAFEVTSGDSVTLIFKNAGQLPKAAMGHNLVILVAGEAIAPFAMAGIAAKDHDYIPQDQLDKILAKTKVLGPGEEDTITFTAPAAGTYNYLCTFPGHFALMSGVMTVK